MLRKILELTLCAVLLLVVLIVSAMPAAPAIPQFRLRDTQGAVHTPAEWAGKQAVLLLFVSTDCPVGNSYVPEMNRIREAYANRGVAVYAVQADTSIAAAEVSRYARDYRYSFPLLMDPAQVLVALTGAMVIPQAAVLSPAGAVLYLGRIDNRVEDFDSRRPEATVHDLRDALDAVLSGKAVARPRTRAIGCAITRGGSAAIPTFNRPGQVARSRY
jgi:peroxiredoxin